MYELRRIAHFKQFDFTFDKITLKLVLQFGANEGFSFENEEVPSILGFKGIKDNSRDGYIHIGYKSRKTLNRHQSDFPVDITCGSQLIFVYIDIIEYQIIGDVRAPVIKTIETERRLRNGSINTVTPIHHKTFTILDYKPILSNNIQNIKVELRNEAAKLIPFNGTGKVIVGLKFQKTSVMEAYYSKQASQSMPHFSGHYRQRGSGFGALAAGIGRVALPLARRIIWPAAKRIGRELLVQGAPELVEAATKRKSAKQALKSTVAKTARKQFGGSLYSRITRGRQVIKRRRQQYAKPRTYMKLFTKKIISRKPQPRRSRLDFSLVSKMQNNIVMPSEAAHSSLDLFEKPPLLVTFDQPFEQKTGPLYSPSGSSLEFEVVGDRKNFIDLQKIYLEVKCRIQNADGTDLRYTAGDATATDAAYFVNNVLHSLFADCTVSANGIKISSANGHYAHKSFIETEFSHGTDAKKTWLKCQGYEYEPNPAGIAAASRDARQVAVRESEQITLYGKLAVDFFS